MGHLWNELKKWSYLRLGQVSPIEGRRWYESKEQESKLRSWRCGLRNKGTQESSRRRQFMVRLLRRPPPLVLVLPRMWATVWASGENVCQCQTNKQWLWMPSLEIWEKRGSERERDILRDWEQRIMKGLERRRSGEICWHMQESKASPHLTSGEPPLSSHRLLLPPTPSNLKSSLFLFCLFILAYGS